MWCRRTECYKDEPRDLLQSNEMSYTIETHCPLGCNDFNNLVMLTLWWLPNQFLRHIHKKYFPFFWAVHLRSKFTKSANKRRKFFFLQEFNLDIKKTAEFHADFESIENVFKKCVNKVISKDVTEICTFSTFTHVRQTCFAYNFLWCIFYNFFNGLKINVKLCFFWYLFWFFPEKNSSFS